MNDHPESTTDTIVYVSQDTIEICKRLDMIIELLEQIKDNQP